MLDSIIYPPRSSGVPRLRSSRFQRTGLFGAPPGRAQRTRSRLQILAAVSCETPHLDASAAVLIDRVFVLRTSPISLNRSRQARHDPRPLFRLVFLFVLGRPLAQILKLFKLGLPPFAGRKIVLRMTVLAGPEKT